MDIQLSKGQEFFLKNWESTVDFVEGTVRSGKTFVICIKYMMKVLMSKDLFGENMIIAFDTPTFERVVLPQMRALFPSLEYKKYAVGGPQIQYRGQVVMIGGYGTKAAFKRVLGSTLKNIYIVECNHVPDTKTLNKIMDRQASYDEGESYFAGDLNPDNPSAEIYDYINSATLKTTSPNVKEYQKMTDNHRISAYHFDFEDNPIMTAEKIQALHDRYPDKQCPIYQSSVLGLRAVATGLLFASKHVQNAIISREQVHQRRFKELVIGGDTSFSNKTKDKTSLILSGITYDGKLVAIKEFTHNNKNAAYELTPSDIPRKIIEFAGSLQVPYAFIDNADAASLSECRKYVDNNYCAINFAGSTKMKIIDRITTLKSWLADGNVEISEDCPNLISEFKTMIWNSNGKLEPQPGNDHSFDAFNYSWAPYKYEIGI